MLLQTVSTIPVAPEQEPCTLPLSQGLTHVHVAAFEDMSNVANPSVPMSSGQKRPREQTEQHSMIMSQNPMQETYEALQVRTAWLFFFWF